MDMNWLNRLGLAGLVAASLPWGSGVLGAAPVAQAGDHVTSTTSRGAARGPDQVHVGSSGPSRQELQESVQRLEQHARELESRLQQARDRAGLDQFGAFVTGSDGGVGDTQQIGTAGHAAAIP